LTEDHANRLNRRITVIRRSDVHLLTPRALRVASATDSLSSSCHLSQLGFGPFQIGLVASATLLGMATVTLAIGFLAAYKDLSF
jgi:hypothetical protein